MSRLTVQLTVREHHGQIIVVNGLRVVIALVDKHHRLLGVRLNDHLHLRTRQVRLQVWSQDSSQDPGHIMYTNNITTITRMEAHTMV